MSKPKYILLIDSCTGSRTAHPFATLQEVDDWFEQTKAQSHFGKPGYEATLFMVAGTIPLCAVTVDVPQPAKTVARYVLAKHEES